MQFRSSHFNAEYVFKSEEFVRDQYGRVIQTIPGLQATFKGPGRLFDSEVAQAQHGWTDDERIQIERGLLSHPMFNQMYIFDGGGGEGRPIGNVGLPYIGLAPGQMVPEEHLEFCKNLQWFQAKQAERAARGETIEQRLCMATLDTPDGTINCPRNAEPGEDYCAAHLPVKAEVG